MLQFSKKKKIGGNCDARDELHSGMIRDTTRAKEAVLFSGLSMKQCRVSGRAAAKFGEQINELKRKASFRGKKQCVSDDIKSDSSSGKAMTCPRKLEVDRRGQWEYRQQEQAPPYGQVIAGFFF